MRKHWDHPSKSLPEAVPYLTGLSQRGLYGQSYRVKENITMEDFSRRRHHVVALEIELVRDQLSRNRPCCSGERPASWTSTPWRSVRGRGPESSESAPARSRSLPRRAPGWPATVMFDVLHVFGPCPRRPTGRATKALPIPAPGSPAPVDLA